MERELAGKIAVVTGASRGIGLAIAQWLQSLSLNLLAAVRVTRAFVPRLNAGAAIVMIASENSILPDPPVMLVARWRM